MTRDDMPRDETNKETSDNAPELLEHPSYEELEKKLTEMEQKAVEYWDRIVRMQAEADNTAKRVERDISNAHKYALERFVSELIPVVDSLELCITNVKDNQSVIEGVQLTLKMFLTALKKFGVNPVNPVSEPFNPEYHQAISMQPHESLPPGSVISVLQKGYILNQRLIRPALVIVAKIEE